MTRILPHIVDICAMLHCGEVAPALDRAQAWLPAASYADVAQWISSAPPYIRPHLTSLLRDVITEYPTMWYGIPVLVRYAPADGCSRLELPLPDCPPDESVRSIGWLPVSVLHDGAPIGMRPGPHYAEAGVPTAAVLLMRVDNADYGAPPGPDDRWWGDAFWVPDGDCVTMTSGAVLPWIDALEACAVMLASATSACPPATQRRFLDDYDAYRAAQEKGSQFWRQYRHSDVGELRYPAADL